MRALACLLLLLAATGCATQAERAARVEREVDDMIRVYGPGCEKLGYTAQTDAWRECVLRLASKDALERREFQTTNCIGHYGFVTCSTF